MLWPSSGILSHVMLSTEFLKFTIFICRLVNQENPDVLDINILTHDINRYVLSVLVL